MLEIFNLIYVEGNLILTFVNLFILIFSFDFLLCFSNAIKSIKGAVS